MSSAEVVAYTQQSVEVPVCIAGTLAVVSIREEVGSNFKTQTDSTAQTEVSGETQTAHTAHSLPIFAVFHVLRAFGHDGLSHQLVVGIVNTIHNLGANIVSLAVVPCEVCTDTCEHAEVEHTVVLVAEAQVCHINHEVGSRSHIVPLPLIVFAKNLRAAF